VRRENRQHTRAGGGTGHLRYNDPAR
jgi:hypothetical protein